MAGEPRHTPGQFRTTNKPRNRIWRAPEILADRAERCD